VTAIPKPHLLSQREYPMVRFRYEAGIGFARKKFFWVCLLTPFENGMVHV
jgi:hypothetical protein